MTDDKLNNIERRVLALEHENRRLRDQLRCIALVVDQQAADARRQTESSDRLFQLTMQAIDRRIGELARQVADKPDLEDIAVSVNTLNANAARRVDGIEAVLLELRRRESAS